MSASVIVTDNSFPGQNGVLSLHADQVTVDSSTVATNAPASGAGASIAISTGALTLRNSAVVVSNARDRGNGGPISVSAGSVLLDGCQATPGIGPSASSVQPGWVGELGMST